MPSSKERFLSDDEIVDHLVESPTSTICWTIHRPKRGWYIKIRAPSFPPDVFISFIPVTQASPYYTDAALSFTCNTSNPGPGSASTHTSMPSFTTMMSTVPSEERASMETDISSLTTHSYPPTPPPSITVQPPPSPSIVHAHLDNLSKNNLPPKRPRLSRMPTRKTEFILTPHSFARIPTTQDSSLFSRAIALFKNNQPSHSCSFNISPLPPPLSPPPYTSNVSLTTAMTPSSSSSSQHSLIPASLHPILKFHDRTPLLTVRSVTGYIEIDKTIERSMGIHTSFWIAVALTYLGFLEDRESYLAALQD